MPSLAPFTKFINNVVNSDKITPMKTKMWGASNQ